MTGVTYVMTHRAYGSVKVGYTSPNSLRLSGLRRSGWEPFRQLVCASTSLAREIEQATLFEVRFRLHIPVHLTRAQMRGVHGWTETSSLSLISPSELWNVVCEQGGLEYLAPIVRPVRQRRGALNGYRRQKGDTPRYAKVARVEAARTARDAQVSAPNQSKAKNATKSTRPNAN